MMIRRERACGIGDAGVACEKERLTAAPAPVDLPAIARSARLRHPLRAPIRIERIRAMPDICKRLIAGVLKTQRCYRGCGGTWQDPAIGRYRHELLRPSVHARLGKSL